MQPILRTYQNELKQQLRNEIAKGNTRVISVLPTGAGKTVTFSSIVKGAYDRSRKTLILTDRIELLTQAGGALNDYNLQPIEIKAGKKPHLGGILYTAMVETLSRRIANRPDYIYWLKTMDIIIIDECHVRSFDKLFPYFREDARILGFTATPRRLGRKNLLSEYYQSIVVGVEIEWLVDNHYLSRPNYYGVKADLKGIHMKQGDYDQSEVADRFSKSKLYKGVVENWQSKTPNTKTLVFSSNVESSKELEQEFRSVSEQVRHLDATMAKKDREDVLRWFKNTSDAILCNVGILTKGFDEPTIETIILYRATKSLTLYLQMVGRGSRIHEPSGKKEFNILDFGNNILNHGFWHDKRDWKLRYPKDQEIKLREEVLKSCKGCEAFIPSATIICPHCGYRDEKEAKEQKFAELQLLNPYELRRKSESMNLKERAEMAKKKLIKPFYVLHKVKTLEEAEEFVGHMGWSKYWFNHNHDRFWWSEDYIKKQSEGSVQMETRGTIPAEL